MAFDLRNRLDYGLRQRLRLSPARCLLRRGPRLRPGHAAAWLARHPDLAAREAPLREAYHLGNLALSVPRASYLEDLYYLELLTRAAELGADAGWQPPHALVAADVGVSHWFYCQALLAALRYWRAPGGRTVDITGYEADAWRLHADLFTRADHALAHMAGDPALTFVPQPFTARPADCQWVSLLFPFVFARDHRRWGLPAALHRPEDLLATAWSSLAPGGLLVVVNQGDAEHRAQLAQMAALGLPEPLSEPFDCPFFQYKVPRRLAVALRS